MKYYLGTTDFKWYKYLSQISPEDINFWQPGGKTNFKLLEPGAPFLFKLKSPYNAIAGIGFFSSHTFLPLSIAWDTFKNRNGCESKLELLKMISGYRQNGKEWWDINPVIGCIVLTNPIFFNEEDWIQPPEDWAKSIVQGKSYKTEDEIGGALWAKIELLLKKYLPDTVREQMPNQLTIDNHSPKYGNDILTRVRLGQGAFRVLITDAYERRCSITGEKTLPVLQAAHIVPFSKDGSHVISNGLLLRSDMHTLFDTGYVTITTDYKIEISKKIKEEFKNGKEYYQFHGSELKSLPHRQLDKPNKDFLDWHNQNVYER